VVIRVPEVKMSVTEEYVSPAILNSRPQVSASWPREWLDEHYRSFKAVTVKQVEVDDDEFCWVVIEPSSVFRGLGVHRYFTAGTDNVPDPDVLQELLERGVEVVVEHRYNPDAVEEG